MGVRDTRREMRAGIRTFAGPHPDRGRHGDMRAVSTLLGAGLIALLAAHTPAIAQGRSGGGACGPDAIGTSRTIPIDAKGGPHFGANQYPGRQVLQPGEVVLTFDDGPHKSFTPRILAALDQHCAKATFFLVGQRALYYPEIAREVARRGHTIGTHTWSHQNLSKISTEAATDEIELAISAVQRSLGAPAAPFFRFPYLADPQAMRQHLRERNTAVFSIDVDSHDFRTRSPTVAIRNVMKGLEKKGRGIILFHDIQPATVGAIGPLLTELKAAGYRVVHFVPRQEQTTLAAYDKKIDRQHKVARLASLPVPVNQRGVVSPAWEVRVYPSSGRRYVDDAYRPPEPMQQPPPRPRPRNDDWLGSLFRGW